MTSIPHNYKEVHAAATNSSERGFPTKGTPAPDNQDAWSAPNNPATKTPAEARKVWDEKEWEGKTLDGRGVGTTGGRPRDIIAHEESAVGGATTSGTSSVKKHLDKGEWESQEGKLGQGAKEAPAATGST